MYGHFSDGTKEHHGRPVFERLGGAGRCEPSDASSFEARQVEV